MGPFLVLAHFTIVGAQYNATGSAILDCAEDWKCTVTGKTSSVCIVESDMVFVNEFGYRGGGKEDDPCYDSKNSGGVNVTDSKEFSSCRCNVEYCKQAGEIMLKGDDCNAKCDNCFLRYDVVTPVAPGGPNKKSSKTSKSIKNAKSFKNAKGKKSKEQKEGKK